MAAFGDEHLRRPSGAGADRGPRLPARSHAPRAAHPVLLQPGGDHQLIGTVAVHGVCREGSPTPAESGCPSRRVLLEARALAATGGRAMATTSIRGSIALGN